MPQQVKNIAQVAYDDYLQNYADHTTFFTLDDFIMRIGNAAADYYLKGWDKYYAELRAERSNEVVCFDSESLSEQRVVLKKDGSGKWVGELEHPAMSLPFDQQCTGFQNVFDAKTGKELERSNVSETWQDEYLPLNSRLFFYIERDKIKVTTKGNCNIQELRILYVPSISLGDGEQMLPDGIVNYCIGTTVQWMKALSGKPIKKTLDQNENFTTETEMNKDQLK